MDEDAIREMDEYRSKEHARFFRTVAVSALLHARETTEKTNPRKNKIAEDADLRALD
jgi:hypothetical protein